MMPFWVRPGNCYEMHALPEEIPLNEDTTAKALCGKQVHVPVRHHSPPGVPPECKPCRASVRSIRGYPPRPQKLDWRPTLRL